MENGVKEALSEMIEHWKQIKKKLDSNSICKKPYWNNQYRKEKEYLVWGNGIPLDFYPSSLIEDPGYDAAYYEMHALYPIVSKLLDIFEETPTRETCDHIIETITKFKE